MFSRFFMSQVKHNSYFLVGLAFGLWLALAVIPLEEDIDTCVSGLITPGPVNDEYEPQREERPLGPAGQAGRSVQRPRYYSTELGMRGGLLAGVLSSEGALESRAAAINRTAARLLPALRFFITASALQAAPGRANVVGFTDTREMLKPFHALKYLADNYLEEYDFFFLISDSSFLNARRLIELSTRLSVSQDVYMGAVADDDTHYCSLGWQTTALLVADALSVFKHGGSDVIEGGILMSNSVLRAVHGELDWCVRNSYSPHHHENIGRCVLHAAHTPCTSFLQGESYVSAKLSSEGGELSGLEPGLADAVSAYSLPEPVHMYQLHAYISRVYLERGKHARVQLSAEGVRSTRRHPRGYRNATWPPALRADAGLAPPPPPTRFDHLRWTRFNATHAFMPDEHRAVGLLGGAYKEAADLIVGEVSAWASKRWGSDGASLVEGAWCWEPPTALRYRLLLRLRGGEASGALRHVEAARPLGATRLAPARYVTESARVLLVLPLPAAHAPRASAFLKRYDSVCLQRDTNTALMMVVVWADERSAREEESVQRVRDEMRALQDKYRGAQLQLVEAGAGVGAGGEHELQAAAARAALRAALARAPRDALLLLALPHMDFTEDFLNRVRMNTIAGEQWFLPLPFARFSQYAHPRFVEADGSRPQQHTGRFPARAPPHTLAVYRADYLAALEDWKTHGGSEDVEPSAILAASPLRALRAPEPALLLSPRPSPCAPPDLANVSDAQTNMTVSQDQIACLLRARDLQFSELLLGARHALAKLLLETQAELA